jgi:DNA-binding response OmpR family regulator
MSVLPGMAWPARAPGPQAPDGLTEPIASSATLLTVIQPARAGDPRVAIVGYLLPPEPLPGAGQAGAAVMPPEDLVIHRDQHRATLSGRDLGLVYQEFELLAFLAAHPNRALTRDEILAGAWPDWAPPAGRTVDIHVHRLRRKLGPGYDRCLVTVRRVGYMFRPPGPS